MQELRLHANKPLSRQLFSHLTTSESALLYTEHSRHLYGLYHTPVMLNKVTQLTWINNGTVSSWTKAVVMLCICHCQLWCNLTRLLIAECIIKQLCACACMQPCCLSCVQSQVSRALLLPITYHHSVLTNKHQQLQLFTLFNIHSFIHLSAQSVQRQQ